MDDSIVDYDIVAVRGDIAESRRDSVAVEAPLEIRIRARNHPHAAERSISVTMRTPGDDYALAVGYLVTEAIIARRDQVMEHESSGPADGDNIVTVSLDGISIDSLTSLDRSGVTTSSCGVCGKLSLDSVTVPSPYRLSVPSLQIRAGVIGSLSERLRSAQSVFDRTGGLHASALFAYDGNLGDIREDIGRHNALDKVIGHAFLSGNLPLSDSILVVSGRASFELVQKAWMAGIPILAAVGAPSTAAVDLARKADMTLIGFLRHDRYNIYSSSSRITLHE
jgi:FdhD protein